MEAVALHTYATTKDDELGFEKGTVVKVQSLPKGDETWLKGEQDGREGWVPSNYLQLKPHDWFKSDLTRDGAEEVLKDARHPEGAFLVRESESCPGDHSLSIKTATGTVHHKVLRDTVGKYFLWVLKFNSINEIVEYHRKASVSQTADIFLRDMADVSPTRVTALYDFNAEADDELGFKKGDLIDVTDRSGPDWWYGELNGCSGSFPATYVTLSVD